MLSADVISLYTYIIQTEAIDTAMEYWDEIKSHTTLTATEFRSMLELCVNEGGYFLYKDRTYKQIKGLAMGNPLCGTLAGIVLDKMLNRVLTGTLEPKITLKYVDDLFIIIKGSLIHELADTLNNSHPTLRFTLEIEQEQTIPYMDLRIIRRNRKIVTDWYCKPIASNRMLNYHSAHAPKTVYNVGLAFAKPVLGNSDRCFHNKNYQLIREILNKNSFPPHVIKRILKQAKYQQSIPATLATTSPQDDQPITKYTPVPYVRILSERISAALEQRRNDHKFRPDAYEFPPP